MYRLMGMAHLKPDKRRLQSQSQASQIEQVRKFIIADAPFTVDNGQMTPTLKVRRHIVQDVYANKIDNLYKR